MTKIYYFSGTGNSLWSAKKIAEAAGNCELYNIGAEAEKDNTVIEAEAVVLVFPSYGYGLPRIVRQFVKRNEFKTPYIASFVTFGSEPLGTLGELRRILKKKGAAKMFFGRIPSVENYLAMFGTPKKETLALRLPMQEKATEDAAKAVIKRQINKVNTFTPISSFISFLFIIGIKILYKCYKINSNCSGCAICQKICPVNAIDMKDNRPVFTHKCEHCQGCIDMCPERAIQFGRVKSGTPGYRHPEIDIQELTRTSANYQYVPGLNP